MGRPPLGLGELGTIRTYGRVDGRWAAKKNIPAGTKAETWRAVANYRDHNGVTAPIERHGPTEAKAKAALNAEARARSGTRASLSARSRFSEFAELWLAEAAERNADTTLARYTALLHRRVLPALGELRVSEIRVSRADDWLASLKTDLSPSSRRMARTIAAQILDIPLRRDLIAANPIRSVSRISGGTRHQPRAFSPTELAEFLTAVNTDRHAARTDLPDLLGVLLGTGMRVGEACGLRWCDIVLGSTPEDSLIQITGNAVYLPGAGVVRHSGKTEAAQRTLPMPPFLHVLLLTRRPPEVDPAAPVFPNERGAFKKPQVFLDALVRLRVRIAPASDPDRWAWVTSHVLRKTVATLLDESGASARKVADILGHADPSMTQRVYMGRGLPWQGAAGILDAAQRRSA